MRTACLVLAFFILCIRGAHNGKFEEYLENVTECSDPQPPYPKKRLVVLDLKLQDVKGTVLLSGRNSVLEDVPFNNFSVRTLSVISGRRELKFEVARQNCRSLAGQAFLVFGGFTFSKKKCVMQRGTGTFKDIDYNKLTHSIPNWHSEGSLVHRVQLAHGGKTMFCHDLFVKVKYFN